MEIKVDDLSHPKVLALLAEHLSGMHENSPPGHVHALDVSGLKVPEVTFWTAWDGDDLMGCGALKQLSDNHGEIKSMRTHADHLRKGVGEKLLQHIIQTARSRCMSKLSLETGDGSAFEPALKLYTKHGFVFGEAFADYEPTVFSQFMHLELAE